MLTLPHRFHHVITNLRSLHGQPLRITREGLLFSAGPNFKETRNNFLLHPHPKFRGKNKLNNQQAYFKTNITTNENSPIYVTRNGHVFSFKPNGTRENAAIPKVQNTNWINRINWMNTNNKNEKVNNTTKKYAKIWLEGNPTNIKLPENIQPDPVSLKNFKRGNTSIMVTKRSSKNKTHNYYYEKNTIERLSNKKWHQIMRLKGSDKVFIDPLNRRMVYRRNLKNVRFV